MNLLLARRLCTLLVAACLSVALVARAQEMGPDELVKGVTLDVVGVVAKDREIQTGSRQKVVGLVEEKVLPHFNFNSMAALAMGQNWTKATPDQKKRLTDEFRILLVRTYASALSAYRDQKFEFRPLRAKPADTDVVVQVRILQQGAQAVSLDYGMEKTAAGWKVYDVIVGGVSLVANYRTDFANIVRDSGVDGLINTLRAKNRSLSATAEKK